MDYNLQFEAAKGLFTQSQARHNEMASQVRFNQINSEVSDLSAKVAKLPAEIAEIRKRNYVFRSYLEHKVEVFEAHWAEIRGRVSRSIDTETDSLLRQHGEISPFLGRINNLENLPDRYVDAVNDVVQRLNQLESNITAASNRISGLYASFKSDVDDTYSQITEIRWMCDERDEASFPFLAGENLFLVARAEWRASGKGKDDPDGILYLTDQRLIFEQKETTGKKLGIFGGKQTQELEWEVPLHQIEALDHENKGFFGGKDIVHFTLGSGARYPKISVEVKGGATNKFWIAQVQRMIKGETQDERAIPPDEELLKTIRNAPSKCHVCGGTLPMLTAGQNQIECAYCGTIIRL
ncbi:MAG: hypothetical protein MUE54_10325 [Anaerolineae bacterium]|jgi:hypothetical protein|nr:hypothetical protein [Anaerolineae bacterium]